MAKSKTAPGAAGNRPAHSRVSFLYQAAALLARLRPPPPLPQTPAPQPQASKSQTDGQAGQDPTPQAAAPLQGMSRRLLTQMRAVSRKTNMRVRPAVKRTVCKYCDTLLVEGDTCVSTVENRSRGGRKPWADVLAVQCRTCERVRRYPVSAPRQPRRPFRETPTPTEAPAAKAPARPARPSKKQNSTMTVRQKPG